MMNCDQAFDLLTDLTRRSDPALQHHLCECPRCRDMADVFDPALELLDDAMTDLRCDGASGEQSPEPDSLTDQGRTSGMLAWQDHSTRRPSRPGRSDARADRPTEAYGLTADPSQSSPPVPAGNHALRRGTLALTACFLLAVTLVTAFAQLSPPDRRSQMFAMTLPPDCQRIKSTAAPAKPEVTVAGCVACHVRAESLAAFPAVARGRASQLVARCVTCHLDHANRHLAQIDSCLFHNSEG